METKDTRDTSVIIERIEYQVQGLVKEINQYKRGGYFSIQYVEEKLEKIWNDIHVLGSRLPQS